MLLLNFVLRTNSDRELFESEKENDRPEDVKRSTKEPAQVTSVVQM